MLRLVDPTPPGWAERAVAHLDAILLDHAHAEKKAAGTAVTLLFQYPDVGALQEPLARLAREELAHFEEVLGHCAARGLRVGRRRASPYAGRLLAAVRAPEPERLLDRLLCAALIEARSCERFGLLAEALRDREPALAHFYRGLLAAEARHHGEYVRLAEAVAPAAMVRDRLQALARHESQVMAQDATGAGLHA